VTIGLYGDERRTANQPYGTIAKPNHRWARLSQAYPFTVAELVVGGISDSTIDVSGTVYKFNNIVQA